MLRAILKKSWKQYPTNKLLSGHHMPPNTQTIQIDEQYIRDSFCRSKDELVTFTHGPLHTDVAVLAADKQRIRNTRSVLTQDAT